MPPNFHRFPRPYATAARRSALVLMASAAWLGAAWPAAGQRNPAERIDERPVMLNGTELARQVMRFYPPVLWESGTGGDVSLRFKILRNGTVDSTTISVVQTTNVGFVEVAKSIARQLRFTPAKERGRPVDSWITVPMHFPSACQLRALIAGDGTYDLPEVDEQPALFNRNEIARQIARQYPPALRDSGVAGTVQLRFKILQDGTVDSTSVSVETATNAAFGDAAASVTRRMRFTPAKVCGQPVKVWVALPITFELQPVPEAGDSARRARPPGSRPPAP